MYVIIDDEPGQGYFRIIDRGVLSDTDTLIAPFGFQTIAQAFNWLNDNYRIC